MDKVLIVEDDRVQRMLITRMLEKHSDRLEVVAAGDGQEAIDILAAQPVSLVVTDIQMPRVNGMQLLAHINTAHPEIPCFVMTAYATERLKAKMPGDLLRFFQKPLDAKSLARSVVAALDRDRRDETQQGISLLSFMHMIATEETTCTLEVTPPEGEGCRMFIREGNLTDAVCGELKGEEAALEAMAWPRSTYKIRFNCPEEIDAAGRTRISDLIRNVTDRFDRSGEG